MLCTSSDPAKADMYCARPEGVDPSALWKLYEEAGAATERQVDRSWSTTQFFLGLSATIVAGALTLLQWRSEPFALLVVSALFIGGASMAAIGLRVLRLNKRYYRALSYKRYLLAHEMGLADPLPGHTHDEYAVPIIAVNATQTKLREMREAGPAYVSGSPTKGSQTDWARVVFLGFFVVDVGAGIALAVLSASCAFAEAGCIAV